MPFAVLQDVLEDGRRMRHVFGTTEKLSEAAKEVEYLRLLGIVGLSIRRVNSEQEAALLEIDPDSRESREFYAGRGLDERLDRYDVEQGL